MLLVHATSSPSPPSSPRQPPSQPIPSQAMPSPNPFGFSAPPLPSAPNHSPYLKTSPTCCSPSPPSPQFTLSRRHFTQFLFTLPFLPTAVHARDGVNRPDLLPSEKYSVLDLERFLSTGEVLRLRQRVSDLESRTGYKIRVLTQRFPQTPGLAVKDYWGVDDNTVVMVADYFGGGQLLKFNVGSNVDRVLVPRFWSNLASKYGNKFYVEKNGEALAIVNAVESIRICLLKKGCAVPPDLDPQF